MAELELFCTIEGTMRPRMVGRGPAGTRIDFPFEGTATGPHWEGERAVSGTDFAVVRGDGNMDLDIHGVIGEKRESVGYRATGVSVVQEDQSAEINELLTFHTGNEDLAWLNERIGVALGRGAEGKLSLKIYVVTR